MHGGGSGGTGSKKKANINVIPLIDVIMFLLATFVLFTLSMNKSTGPGGISLNEGTTGIDVDPNRCATISVNTEGQVFWDKVQMTWDGFIIKLMEYSSHEDPTILINFDQAANFGQSMSVLDEIRKASQQPGAKKITVYVSTKQPQASR